MKKTDRRVIKTKKSIRHALNELMLKKEFKSITITEISKLADIDRKTFYLHYESVDDVLDEFTEELQEKVFQLLTQKKSMDIDVLFQGLNSIMMENYELYKMAAKQKAYVFFIDECKKILKNTMFESYFEKSGLSKEVFQVYAEYISSGIINIYINWLNSNSTLTIEELAEIAKDAVVHGWERIFPF